MGRKCKKKQTCGKRKVTTGDVESLFFVDKENTNQTKNNAEELLLCNLFMVNQKTNEQQYHS